MSVDLKAHEAETQTPLETLAQLTPPELVSASLRALAGITERDAKILVCLSEAIYLTTLQIAEVAPFKAERRSRRRLEFLRERGLVDLIGKNARGRGVPPAWCLTSRGAKAVGLFGASLPESALSKGASMLKATLRASDFYSLLRAQSDMATWTPAPKIGGKDEAKALRPWALVQMGGGKSLRHVAVEIDRPSRRQSDLAVLVARWSTWRTATSGTNVVIYVCSDERRARAVQEIIDPLQTQIGTALTRWFHATSDPRGLWTGRGPEGGP